jgi:hypothetical protein
MIDSEGLSHDLCWLLGIRCKCSECNNSRVIFMLADVDVYGRKIAADIEANRKRGIN